MSTANSRHILLWSMTKRASKIAVVSRPTLQFTSSNNAKLMKCNLRDYPAAFQCVSYWFPFDSAVIWRCTSPTTIFSPVSIAIVFERRIWTTCLIRPTAIRYEYGRSLTALILIPNVALLQTERFPTDTRPLDRRLVAHQRPTWTPLTTSFLYVCILSLPSEHLLSWEFDFHWFPVEQWVFRVFGHRVCVPHIEILLGDAFSARSIFIVFRSTNRFRGEWTSDLSSSHWVASHSTETYNSFSPCR